MIEWIGALVLSLCSLVGVLLRYAPFTITLSPLKKKKLFTIYTILVCLNQAILLIAVVYWGVEGAFGYLRYGMVIFAAVMTLVNILVINGKIREHLFVFGVVITCNYLLMSVPNYLITFLPGRTHSEYLLVVLVVYSVLLAATYWPVRQLLRNAVEPFMDLERDEYWNPIWFVPMALFATRFLFAGGTHNTGSLLQLLSSAVTVAVVVWMCLSISADHVHVRRRQAMEQQLTDQKIQYSELVTRVEDARKTKHDLKHHLAAILHFVELDEKESVRSYCNDLMVRIDGKGSMPYTGNTAVDGVLYYYMQQAQACNIDMQCLGVIRSQGIADMDLCILLGNALDNAVAACSLLPEGRSIQVISQSEEKLLSMMIRNSFDGHVQEGRDGLLSRKREQKYGVGLRSMRSVCEHYGGTLETTWDDHTFTTVIILPLTE